MACTTTFTSTNFLCGRSWGHVTGSLLWDLFLATEWKSLVQTIICSSRTILTAYSNWLCLHSPNSAIHLRTQWRLFSIVCICAQVVFTVMTSKGCATFGCICMIILLRWLLSWAILGIHLGYFTLLGVVSSSFEFGYLLAILSLRNHRKLWV